ncbi:MAG: hypothetical protein A2655_01305 [Candidatus Yanofskybacteria bacterium RIFCSPHIGHO2_01_FULL_43_42]|uniref:Uncharacterized protein n=1 Tax=Candidatus Yanofskybacteria bacterium RIFCSPLOWO2_01_FULL_43_22 TaxID=1802695 RepID=A0A1F8GGL0_9BACT|nr:MAG: hypothetical protein A2655_01305 [Candidatus Yanofskybacteria bacterium RIFCSPHIGHO2_01_FULL_43_42]OGN13122.1 MAG: hypothetical protein A3D48_02220 [Candidatus Yanofskybacteria bacterium RIFCSPHIGHO2_02_FULL_43_17]OGN24535.1 MAG: hypothetical protein A3A13_00435 [Candidatus Yanofskybacteria bacterium RIFCSPLOWO2_01_FULL_43_22]
MAEIKLFIIFLIVLVLDGFVLSAFFGLRNSSLSLLLLVVPLLYMGPKIQFVACGLFFSVILEMSKGIGLGGLVLPFLFTSVAIYLTQRFLDIQYTYDARFGLGKSVLIALMSAVFIYVFSFFYKQGGLNIEYFNPVIGLTMVLEALALVLLFNIVFDKKSDYARI